MSVMSAKQKPNLTFWRLNEEQRKIYGQSLIPKIEYIPASSGQTAYMHCNYRLVYEDGKLGVYYVTYIEGEPKAFVFCSPKDHPMEVVEAFYNEPLRYDSAKGKFV